jgi:hypothetical protein
MIVLKALSFIVWNILLGLSLVELFNWFLFNRKARIIFGWHLPLTPGFLVRKRDWLFTKAKDILHDYLEQAGDYARKNGYLAKWENLVRDMVFEKTSFVNDWPLLPRSLKDKIHAQMADLGKNLASSILRKLVPSLIEQFRIEHKIEDFDEQFNIEFFYGYFHKYVYKPMIYAFMALNFLIGLTNMILYLLLQLF